jgi:hypothetical protein
VSDPVPLSALKTLGVSTITPIGSDGAGNAKILSAAEIRAAAGLSTSDSPSFAGLTLTGPVTGTSGRIQQRSGLIAQQYDIFSTYTSDTSFQSLCLKATASAMQIGSARGTSDSNLPVQLGHFNSAGAFTAGLTVAIGGEATASGGLATAGGNVGVRCGGIAIGFSLPAAGFVAGGQLVVYGSGTVSKIALVESQGVRLASDHAIWFSSTTSSGGTPDVGFRRNAAGVAEINSGTSGTFRDLIVRNLRMAAPTLIPASASATGSEGQIAWDSAFIYVCIATNTWKRVAIATW